MRVAGRADSLICIIVPGAGAGGLRSVRAVGRAGYEKKMTRAPLLSTQKGLTLEVEAIYCRK